MNLFKGGVVGRWAKELMNHSMMEYLMKNYQSEDATVSPVFKF